MINSAAQVLYTLFIKEYRDELLFSCKIAFPISGLFWLGGSQHCYGLDLGRVISKVLVRLLGKTAIPKVVSKWLN